jgi:3-deoxy-manno-octulosonate cytidylyltransferase (CMP-KDO synthetase)
MSDIIAIIPARFASTRFPGKPLASETGKPMIQHVCEAAGRAVDRVVVATDDQRIIDAVTRFGGEAVMTSPEHPNGTSRLCEAATILALDARAVIVNVQGDEPEIEPQAITSAAQLVLDGADIGTISCPLDAADLPDPNIVKVITEPDGRAIDFFRVVPPGTSQTPARHVGIYAYTFGFLQTYVAMPPTEREQDERLEQLRALESGARIMVHQERASRSGIDTPEQYEAFVRRWRAAHGV